MSRGKKIVRAFGIFIIAACVIGVLMLTSFHSRAKSDSICSELHVSIDHSTGIFFLEPSDIKNMLARQLGDTINGDRLDEIRLGSIEEIIEGNPYTDEAEIFLDANGELHINIVQKQPLARVINRYGVHYYITAQGNKIPVSTKFTCRVPVITGNIEEGIQNPDTIETKTLNNVLHLARFIHQHPFWNAQTEQIAVSNGSEISIIPKLGDHLIRFGTIENMELKFENLESFYKNGLNYTGWETYRIINVQFDGQVVCTKTPTYEQQ
jgi:cell division protein FtsQ